MIILKPAGSLDVRRWKPVTTHLFFRLLFLPLAFLLGALSPTPAQEIVDPRSGRLLVTVTDLVVAAGPVNLEVRRALLPDQGESGLLGSRWRLNVERRLVKEKSQIRIETESGPIVFTQEGSAPDYKNAFGERIHFEKNGQALYTKKDGTKETYTSDGLLKEIDHRNYNKVIFSYGANKRLSRIEGPRKHFLKITTDPQGRLSRIESSNGDQITYQYSGENLSQVQISGASPIRYQYDEKGLLTQIYNPKTGEMLITYDDKSRVLSRRFADGGQEQHKYSSDGNEHEVVDSMGGLTKRKWSDDGTREEITNPLGHKTLIEKNALGLPNLITDPLGNKIQMTYDRQGRLTSLKDGSGKISRFEYLKDLDLLTTIIQPDSSKQVNQYDGQMNLIEVRRGTQVIFQQTYYADGATKNSKELGKAEERFNYDQTGRLSTQGNALGHLTRFEYDRQGNLIRRINPLGGVTLFKYDNQKQLISLTDPGNGTTQYEYNPQGFLSKALDSAGGVKTFQYDTLGRLVSMTSPSGQKTLYEYDRAGRITRQRFPDGRSERFHYDRVGNRMVWINAQGLNHQFEYDPLGRLIKEKTAAGLEISYGYDIQGNLVSWRDSAGGGENLKYDQLGRMSGLKTSTGSIIGYSYDLGDRLTSITNPLGQVKKFAYNQSGNLSEVSEPEGTIGRYTFDYAGRLTGIKHPSGGETRFTYDPLGNVLSLVDPLGQAIKRTFDSAGRLKTVFLPQGQSISYKYNSEGLVVEKILPDQKKILYQYDRERNPLQVDDGTMVVRFNRDATGRLTKLAYPHLKKTLTYEYNSAGFISKLIDSEGQSTHYEYDKANHLKTIKTADGKVFLFTYDQKERLKSLTYPNGLKGDWEYDPEDRVVRLAYSNSQGGPLLTWQYRYDSDGNRIETIDHKGKQIRYRYDQAGQLVEESPEGEDPIRYSYSPGGNRIKKEVEKKSITYRTGRGDQLVQAGQEILAYDNQGNLIEIKGSKGTKRYVYDPENRLIKVINPDQSEITYGYSPTGERAWRKDASALTTFITDGVNVLAELKEDLRAKAQYLHAPGVDRPLMMTRDGKTFYYHPDATGNIVALTDEKGRVTDRYEYDAFGNIKKRSGQTTNPFAFSARDFDPATGLYYFRARYYDPELGRFLSKDPASPTLDRPFSLNPYLYAGNNPLRYIDPFGLDFTPAEQLYIAEMDARNARNLAQNPQRYGLPQGAFQEDYLANAQKFESDARTLRNRYPGLTPQRPAVYGPNSSSSYSGASGENRSAGSSAGGNRPGTIRVNAPAGGNRPGTIKLNAPSPGGVNAPTSGPGGLTRPVAYGVVGGVVGAVGIYVNIQACLDEGRSTTYCYGQLGLGLAGGVVVGGILVFAGVPATALAVGGTALATAGSLAAGSRWSQAPETRALAEQQASQQAQAVARVRNVLAGLEGRAGALITLGKAFCSAQSSANDRALKAKNAAEGAKKNLEATLGSINAEVSGSLLNNCTQDQSKLVSLPGNITQVEDWISKSGQGYQEAIKRLALCASQKDVDDADYFLKGSTAMTLSAERKLAEILADIEALSKSIPKSKETVKSIREKMSNLENSYLAIGLSVDNFVSETETWAKTAEDTINTFNTQKSDLLRSVENLKAVVPDQLQGELLSLKSKISNIVPPCSIKSQDEFRDIAKAAKESISVGLPSGVGGLGSMLSMGALAVQKLAIDSALNTCGSLNPPTGREADKASLALVKLGMKIKDWLTTIAKNRSLCLAKLNPKPAGPTKPPSTQTGQSSTGSTTSSPPVTQPPSGKPPSTKTLAGLAANCPTQASVGETVQCSAVGLYEGEASEDLTKQVTWTPYTSRFTILRKPDSGVIIVNYSFKGFSGTLAITINEKTRSTTPAPPPPPPSAPGTKKLVGFVWDCYPQKQVRVGGKVQCKAWGMFEGENDFKVVTDQVTWDPEANFNAPSVKPESGYLTVTAIYWGERGTKSIKVVDQTGYDPTQDPGVPGRDKPVDPEKIKDLTTGFAGGSGQGGRPPKPQGPQAPPISQPTEYGKPPGQPPAQPPPGGEPPKPPAGGDTTEDRKPPPPQPPKPTTGGDTISGMTKPQPPKGYGCVDCLVNCTSSFPADKDVKNVIPQTNCRKACVVGPCDQQCRANCANRIPEEKGKCLMACDDQKNRDVKNLDKTIKEYGGK